ncbi:MAG: F0F1 ATP synthase subunit A [Armatimonadia bacterium]|nr:F0F1 ATP synthase subunit A [Armatimonadia bacterium]
MNVTPDQTVYVDWGFVKLNATLVFSWLTMLLLVLGSWLITRRITATSDLTPGQNLMEVLVKGMESQIEEISQERPRRYLPFVGTLFVYIAVCNILSVVPWYEAPTGSLSTTAALAVCVFVAVPYYGIRHVGIGSYLKQYVKPNPMMLPFNIIGELSRTLALAVRLFGNIMSGSMIVAILLAIAPLFFPVVMHALGLLTGLVQAYIFAVLAMVYIASASKARRDKAQAEEDSSDAEDSEGES